MRMDVAIRLVSTDSTGLLQGHNSREKKGTRGPEYAATVA